MAVYTRFGSKLRSIEWFDDENGEIAVVLESDPKKTMIFHSSELKADGGIREIWDSAEFIRNPRNPGTDPREIKESH